MKKTVEAIIRQAGSMVNTEIDPETYVKEGHANFVTETDIAVQKFLHQKLSEAFPEAKFFSEEDETHELTDALTFIIDPIDGTTNYMRHRRCSVISIGAVREKKPFFGMIYHPYADQLFYAEQGKGAWCNEARLHVSSVEAECSLINLGTSPYNSKLAPLTAASLSAALGTFADVRRSGSAANDLCDIAMGLSEGMFEWNLQPWDYCAGSVLIAEAGGICGNILEPELTFDRMNPFIAGTPAAYDKLRALLWDAMERTGIRP